MFEPEHSAGAAVRARRYDVFLSHNSLDKPTVERIAEKLKRAGLEPWLDKWFLAGGGAWQDELAAAIRDCDSCAVFVGPNGLGDWARMELSLALDRAAKDRSFRLFLVLLPELPEPFDASTLPPFLNTRTWVDFREGFAASRTFQRLVNAIKGIAPGPDVVIDRRDDISPYLGLQSFDEENEQFFFGRDADTQRLVEKLKVTRFLAVLGPSGSGKSSLVRAGLIPALRRGALPESETWTVQVIKPGAHPLTALTAHLLRLYPQGTMQKTLDEMSSDQRTLHLATSLALVERPPAERIIWVVDQFEEVFTLCYDERERAQFLSNLLYAASIPDGRNVLVLTMRADFYYKCAAYPELSALIASHQFLVSQMDVDGLRQAIEEPARRVGLEFEEGLTATILDDVQNQPGALPLLEHALLELWERRRGQMLTLEGYRESGGVEGAIAKRADDIYNSLSPEQETIVRRVMLRLTQPGECTEDTRRRATMSELVTRPGERDAVENVLKALTDARLLTTGGDEQGTDEQLVDVSHEALIRGWPRLRGWIEENRAALRIQRRLTESAQEWKRCGWDDGVLYRGARLVEAREWRKLHEDEANELELKFINESEALQLRERRLARRRMVLTIGGLIVALVLISIAAVFSYRQKLIAENESARIETLRRNAVARELADDSLQHLTTNPELSTLLAVEAVKTAQMEESLDALRQALLIEAMLYTHETGGNAKGATANSAGTQIVSIGERDDAWVWNVNLASSPDGKKWREPESKPAGVMQGHDDQVFSASFSPDGSLIVTASKDATARVWATASGNNLSTDANGVPLLNSVSVLRGHTKAVRSANFSADGKYIVTGSEDGTARVWDSKTGKQLKVLTPPANSAASLPRVVGASFSCGGSLIITSVNFLLSNKTASVGRIDVWDTTTWNNVSSTASPYPLYDASFSPDCSLVSVATQDEMGRSLVTQLNTDKSMSDTFGELVGHGKRVRSAGFSPDGKYIVTASYDETARLWDARTKKSLLVLRGQEDRVNSAAFTADGKFILTASDDETVLIRNTNSSIMFGDAPTLLGIAKSRVTRELTPEEREKHLHESERGN